MFGYVSNSIDARKGAFVDQCVCPPLLGVGFIFAGMKSGYGYMLFGRDKFFL
jgi:hypothetical protein